MELREEDRDRFRQIVADVAAMRETVERLAAAAEQAAEAMKAFATAGRK
jgi:hypothetical protein